MQDIKLKLAKRDVFGKKVKNLTRENKIIGNIYGKGEESQAVVGDYNVINKVISQAGKNHPIELEVEDGKNVLALVHDIERDPLTQKVHHVTFKIVIKGQKVITEIPIKAVGDAPAERTGKILVNMTDKIEIEAIPSKIPETIEVDVSGLAEEGDIIHVSDLKMDDDVELKSDPEAILFKVDLPRAEVEAEEEEDEAEGDAADVPSDHGGDEEGESKDTEDSKE